MPDTYNDRAVVQAAPARIASDGVTVLDSPSKKGAAGGGLDNMRANQETYRDADSRAEASSPTRAPVQSFDPDCV